MIIKLSFSAVNCPLAFKLLCRRCRNMSRGKTIPVCPYLESNDMTRLSTLSHLSAHCQRRNISAILLAGSGITFSSEENFLECIHCAKVTMVVNGTWRNFPFFKIQLKINPCISFRTKQFRSYNVFI